MGPARIAESVVVERGPGPLVRLLLVAADGSRMGADLDPFRAIDIACELDRLACDNEAGQ